MRPRGSIRAKGTNHWEIRYYVKGQRHHLRFHGTLQQAQKHLTAALKNADDDNATLPNRVAVGTVLDAWLNDGRVRKKSDAWQRLNGDSVRHWQRHIGHTRLQALTALDVMRARDRLLTGALPLNPQIESGPHNETSTGTRKAANARLRNIRHQLQPLSPKTVANDIGTLRVALGWAQRLGYVARNVALDVEVPAVEQPPVAALNLEHAEALLAVLWKWERSETNMLATGLMLGVRIYSELGGQPRAALDLTKRTLELQQVLLGQVKDGQGHWVQKLIRAGNNKHKRRLLEIPERAVPFLERQVNWLNAMYGDEGVGWNPHRLLFPNGAGLPMKPSTLHRVFKQALAKAELPDTNVHALRHTCASLLLRSGASMKVVQATLGHSSYRLTADTYAHLEPGRVREALDGVWTAPKIEGVSGGMSLEPSIFGD